MRQAIMRRRARQRRRWLEVGWHHQLNGHEFEQAAGDGEGQGNLVCCSPWGRKELAVTQPLNNNNVVTTATWKARQRQFQRGVRVGSSLRY